MLTDPQVKQRRTVRSDDGPLVILSPIELRPAPFQERVLEQIDVARKKGHHRNRGRTRETPTAELWSRS